MDLEIIRALRSGEMHNWFVCQRRFKKSNEELHTRYGQIRNQKEYMKKLYDEIGEDYGGEIIDGLVEKAKTNGMEK